MAWQRMQGGEGGDTTYWYDPASGQYSQTDPAIQAGTLSGLLGYGAPTTTSGGAEGGTDITTTPLSTVAGTPVGQYQVRQVADKMYGTGEVGPAWEAQNPQTGQWEPAWRLPWSVAGNNMTFVPMSIAQQIPGSVPLSDMASGKTAGHLEDNLQGLEALGVGVGGPLAGGAITSALGGAGAVGAGLGGATTADIAGLTGASGAIGGGSTLASLAGGATGAAEAITPYELAVGGGAAAGPTGFGTIAGGAAAGGASIADLGAGTFGSPGADATAAQATSGGTIGSGGYDAATAAAAGAGATSIGSTAASGASALSKILAGNGTAADYASLLGQAAPGLLGAYGASQQASALSDLADKYYNAGAPSRARYEASMTPGFDPTTIPGYSGALDSASGAILSKLSTQGNPYGNPGALIEANKQIVNGTALPAVQNYQSLNANAGGISSMNAAAPGVAQQAIGSSGGVLSALGSAAGNVLNQPQSLSDLLKSLGYGGGGTSLA